MRYYKFRLKTKLNNIAIDSNVIANNVNRHGNKVEI